MRGEVRHARTHLPLRLTSAIDLHATVSIEVNDLLGGRGYQPSIRLCTCALGSHCRCRNRSALGEAGGLRSQALGRSYPTRPESAGASTATGPYVALGDSYASGYGLPEATGEPVSGCGQSRLDYPHLLARELALPLTDVTCAGATTSDEPAARRA